MKRQDGYTLIELMIVLAIMAGMVALCLPSINHFVKSIDNYNAVSKQMKAIESYRNAAFKEDGPVWFDDVWWCPFQCEGITYDVGNRRIKVGKYYEIQITAIAIPGVARYNNSREEH